MTDKIASATNILPFPGPAERAHRRLMAYLFARQPSAAEMYAKALDRQRGAVQLGMFGGAK